uniref:Uncharacterized membrane protein n=1 Tax=Candidatus Kentrum sp. TUN TaxID=2126343 RepID=A0A450ZMQ8_9GAMM|nr:MAG: Uncharacterized membrane protein [Candidatus Kentron sp. TUN]
MNQELFHTLDKKTKSAKRVTTLVYLLQAVSFLFGITFLIAIIINYIKKEEVQGTWLESHFRWQIRTFWFSILWNLIGVATVFTIGYPIFIVTFIWIIYRIVKGWMRLADGKEMYVF